MRSKAYHQHSVERTSYHQSAVVQPKLRRPLSHRNTALGQSDLADPIRQSWEKNRKFTNHWKNAFNSTCSLQENDFNEVTNFLIQADLVSTICAYWTITARSRPSFLGHAARFPTQDVPAGRGRWSSSCSATRTCFWGTLLRSGDLWVCLTYARKKRPSLYFQHDLQLWKWGVNFRWR